MEKGNATEQVGVTVTRGAGVSETMTAKGVYTVECFDKDGNLKFRDTSDNVITTQGKNYILDKLGANTYAGPWYCGLVTAGTATSTSTYASPTVTEWTGISTRATFAWSSGTSTMVLTCSFSSVAAAATVTGYIMVTGGSGVTTTGNTAATGGVLCSASAFSSGSKILAIGDSLNITWTCTV
jgi:hypothetical protein